MTDPFGAYARFYDLDVGQIDDDLFMIREFAARTGSPILELACGTGRVLLPLAREGHHLTGVDVSPAMLELARQKLDAEGLASRVDLVQQDMRHLDLDRRFNLALVALSSFCHLLSLSCLTLSIILSFPQDVKSEPCRCKCYSVSKVRYPPPQAGIKYRQPLRAGWVITYPLPGLPK